MSNNAVRLPCHYLNRAGYATLRYDFRGVGLSDGKHEGGRGAREDILTAVEAAKDKVSNKSLPLILAGYSFGAWITWAALNTVKDVHAAVMVSPPFGIPDFVFKPCTKTIPPTFAISGSGDQFCSPEQFIDGMNKLCKDAHTELIENVDHMWFGKEKLLADKIISFIDQALK